MEAFCVSDFSGLQTYPSLHPPPAAGRSSAGVFAMRGCEFVYIRSSQMRAWEHEFVHVCFGLLGLLVQVVSNLDAFGAEDFQVGQTRTLQTVT